MTKARLPATERVIIFNQPSEGYWVIPSEKGDILLANTLLPAMTQEQSAKYQSKSGFHSMSMLEHFELFNALYELRNKGGDVEKARLFIQGSIRNSFPNTQTRVIYTPRGFDRVIHNYRTDSAVEKKAKIVGADGNVVDVLTQRVSLALTGKTPEQVAELLQYINETPTYVCRLNQKPASVVERVVGLCASSVWADLEGRCPRNVGPSLGVKFVANN